MSINQTIFLAILFLMLGEIDAQDTLNLHVPSPDWEDQIIYFLMTDRFNDGDPNNNDQGYNEYDPQIAEKYSGGDIQGVIDKLDYIQNLGATAIWITPPVANQWWDETIKFGGYHGYWAEHFKEVDKHLGTINDYQQLSHQLHQRGMYLIQDIVINHTGNFHQYLGAYNPENPIENFNISEGSLPVKSPTQYPFNLNDVRIPEHRKMDIYHWTPEISNFNAPNQLVNYQLGNLDDINTQNVVVREVFRDSYGYWIQVVGVDGFRIDTVIYVEKDFWNDFIENQDEKVPGMKLAAQKTGRDDFISFGEAFLSSKPLDNKGDKEVASFMGTNEKPGLNSMINFPLYFSINRVFAQGMPTQYLGFHLNSIFNEGIYRNPFRLVNFIDNHDTDRFINNSTEEGLKQALYFLFTIPGIPIVYMGTEQLMHETRASMFRKGWGAEGKDHFDEHSSFYSFIKDLSTIRKSNKVLTRGQVKVLKDSNLGPGVLVFSRQYKGEEFIMVFNTAEERILLSNLKTDLPTGTRLRLVSGMHLDDDLFIGQNGYLTIALPKRSVGIFAVENTVGKEAQHNRSVSIKTTFGSKVIAKDFKVKGKIAILGQDHVLVIDGKLKSAIPIKPNKKGKWKIVVPGSKFPFGVSDHELTVYTPSQNAASAGIPFTTHIKIQGESKTVQDAVKDDHGLAGQYTIPKDPSYGDQMDIRAVKTTAFGGNLRVEITMGDITQMWMPPNGFDHVLFHVFIDLPNSSGNDYIPMLNTKAPSGFEWDYAAYIGGWLSAYYSAEGSTEKAFGKKLAKTPRIEVDVENNKVTFQFSPDALGYPETLEGAKIYITTWDSNGSEGGYRGITEEGGVWRFGGASDLNPILILDDTEVIQIN